MANFSKGFSYGIITGAALGAIVGLLLAPDKGSNTRNKLTYRVQTYIDELKNLIEELSENEYAVSDAKRQGDEVVEDARQKAEDLLKEAENLLNTISIEKN